MDRSHDSLLRICDVKRRTGLSTAKIYRRAGDGTFPPKQQIGPKCVAWHESDLNAFVANPMGYRAWETETKNAASFSTDGAPHAHRK